MTDTSWAASTVFWHVYPLGFLGAPQVCEHGAPPVDRLRRLEPWLDHMVDLGADGLLLGPVFEAHTHGYDTVDHRRIDRRLGTEQDFARLVAQCAERGIRVVLDGVFNHVGRGFAPLADLLERGESSGYASWFRRDRNGELAVFEGHSALVALNHQEPAVADYVVDVMTHWLARGIAGWRLDAAYAVPPPFWREVTERVREAHPEAWIFGEVIHGDHRRLVAETGWDSLTQYELWKAVWSSLNDRNLFELSHALSRHDQLLSEFVPQTFLGNHDVTRLASRLSDAGTLAHALVVLMTVGGTPSIYAGDEHGFIGVKENRAGGDDAIRPAFPDGPRELSPLGEPLFRLHQELIALRRRHRWVGRARTRVLSVANTSLMYESTGDAGQRLVVALNLEPTTARMPLEAGEWLVDAGSGSVTSHHVRLEPVGWAVLRPA